MVRLFAVKIIERNEFERYIPFIRDTVENNNNSPLIGHYTIKQRSLLGKMMTHKILSSEFGISPDAIKIITNEHNKPALESQSNIHFNLSHSGDWVIAAFSSKPVGIDIEKIKPVNLQIAWRFFSENEVEFLKSLPEDIREHWFLKLWTIKESYLKALGTGLSRPMRSFSVNYRNGDFQIIDTENPTEVYLKHQNFKINYLLSVAAFNNEIADEITIYKAQDLLE